jgi:hypothetical protein
LPIAASLPIKNIGVDRETRLEIYQDAFFSRLYDCIIEDFPRTFEKIQNNEEFFKKFLVNAPSTFANPIEYSETFLRYVSLNIPELSELAQLEWNKCLAIYTQDAIAMDVQTLANLSEADLMTLRLKFQPSLRLSRMGQDWHLTYRTHGTVEEVVISEEKAQIVSKILQNKSIEEIMEVHQDENVFSELFSFLAAKQLITK